MIIINISLPLPPPPSLAWPEPPISDILQFNRWGQASQPGVFCRHTDKKWYKVIRARLIAVMNNNQISDRNHNYYNAPAPLIFIMAIIYFLHPEYYGNQNN